MTSEGDRATGLVSDFAAMAMVVNKVPPKDLIRAFLEVAATIAIRDNLTDYLDDELDRILGPL
jgi:hypothetical protein